MKELKLNAFKISQQIGDFFVAKIEAKDLVTVSYSDIRSLDDGEILGAYLGIQRPLNKKRANEIKDYVNNMDATFPSSVILSLESGDIHWNERSSILTIYYEDENTPAKILDGQHRIAGFMDVETKKPIHEQCYFERDGEELPFELIITVFVGLDLTEQATVFSVVNLKQTKVSKSLVYDLEAYSSSRSPYKTAHDIVVALDSHSKSPFYQKIKRLGLKEGDGEILTQAALVEEIIELISKNPMQDRDYFLRKSKQSFSFKREGIDRSDYADGIIFRNLFIDEKDGEILKVILSFFLEIKNKFENSWANNQSILNKTVGVKALFRVLREICKSEWLIDSNIKLDSDYFKGKLSSVEISDSEFLSLPAKSSSTKTLFEMIQVQLV